MLVRKSSKEDFPEPMLPAMAMNFRLAMVVTSWADVIRRTSYTVQERESARPVYFPPAGLPSWATDRYREYGFERYKNG